MPILVRTAPDAGFRWSMRATTRWTPSPCSVSKASRSSAAAASVPMPLPWQPGVDDVADLRVGLVRPEDHDVPGDLAGLLDLNREVYRLARLGQRGTNLRRVREPRGDLAAGARLVGYVPADLGQ